MRTRSPLKSLTSLGYQASLRGLRKVRIPFLPLCPCFCSFRELALIRDTYRNEFQKSIGLDRKDFGAIEYLLRRGQRQLEMYAAPGIKDVR